MTEAVLLPFNFRPRNAGFHCVLQFVLRSYRTGFLGKRLQDRGQICRNFDDFASVVLSFAWRKIDKQAVQLYLAPIEPFDLSTTQPGEARNREEGEPVS